MIFDGGIHGAASMLYEDELFSLAERLILVITFAWITIDREENQLLSCARSIMNLDMM